MNLYQDCRTAKVKRAEREPFYFKSLRHLLARAETEEQRTKRQKHLLKARKNHLLERARQRAGKDVKEGRVIVKKQNLHRVTALLDGVGPPLCNTISCLAKAAECFTAKWSGTDMQVETLLAELAEIEHEQVLLRGEELIMAAFLIKKSSMIDHMCVLVLYAAS
jgi:hypothetical protein